jgi:RHS repeat-associated protein
VEQREVLSSVYNGIMVLRDRDSDPTTAGLEERLVALHDANFNVTAVVGEDGSGGWEVKERYLYDPYGERTVIDADWSSDADGLSDVAWHHGHQGGRHSGGDAAGAGLVNFRFRELDTSLGRWTRQDPAGYVDGANLVTYLRASPISGRDPSGLATFFFNDSTDGVWIYISPRGDQKGGPGYYGWRYVPPEGLFGTDGDIDGFVPRLPKDNNNDGQYDGIKCRDGVTIYRLTDEGLYAGPFRGLFTWIFCSQVSVGELGGRHPNNLPGQGFDPYYKPAPGWRYDTDNGVWVYEDSDA